MIIIEQVAVRTHDIDRSIEALGILGHYSWVKDTVQAEHLYVDREAEHHLGERFTVRLAFNYDYMPGIEYELIQLMEGMTWQLVSNHPAGDYHSHYTSHFGYHTTKDQSENGYDTLLAEIERLQRFGLRVMQVSQTTEHKNTDRRYRYAFMTGRLTDNVPIKIIQRLLPKATVEQGKELFSCLSQS